MDSHLLRFRKDIKYVFVDLETFNLNLNFHHNRFWQIGILEVNGESINNALDIRVNWPDAPHLKISSDAARITRYNQQEHNRLAIKESEAFEKAWPIIKSADYIIGHNCLSFDLPLIKEWALMHKEKWKWMVPKIIDTDALSRGYKLNISYDPQKDNFTEYLYRMQATIVKGCKTNLTAMGKEFKIEHDYDTLHEAINDLKLNLKTWNQLKYKVEI